MKWHVNCIVFLSNVHCYPSLTNIIDGIVLHVVLLGVTCTVPGWNFVYMFIVSVHYIVMFVSHIILKCLLQCLSMGFGLTDPRDIVQL